MLTKSDIEKMAVISFLRLFLIRVYIFFQNQNIRRNLFKQDHWNCGKVRKTTSSYSIYGYL